MFCYLLRRNQICIFNKVNILKIPCREDMCLLNNIYDRLWVRSRLEEIKYLIFSFSRPGNYANRGNSIRNASRIRPKMGNGSVLTLGSMYPLSTLLYAG